MSKVVLLALLALLQQGGAANVKTLPEIVHHETAGGGSEVTGQITLHCPAQPAPSCPALDHLLLYLNAQLSLEGQLEQLKNRTDRLDGQLQQLGPQDLAEFQATIEALQATVSSQDSIIQQQAAALQQLQETLQQLDTINQQQATTIQQHTNSLQQLEATNQQQASNLQQLEATNQQQASSLQQLEATNQQHAISLQQLDATNQQQASSLQQLEATNQQQASSLQQLEVTNQQQAKSLQQLETTNQQQGSNLQQLNTTIQQQGTALLQQEENLQQQEETLQQQEETLQQQANAIHQQETTLQQCTTNLQQLEDKVTAPQSCSELLNSGHNTSGVYTLYPAGEVTSPIHVYCDMDTDGGGWTVFQRRKDGSVDFYLDWQNYKTGFGELGGEFWLGNDHLHHLTAQGGYELRVDLEDFEGNSTFAKYSNFRVEDEGHLYRLTVEGYSGTAGNSMARHSSMFFSTKDKENDIRESFDCAQAYKGGWWYSNCHTANLNGLYHGGAHQSYADGVNWKSWKGYHYSLKHTEMKIRPR